MAESAGGEKVPTEAGDETGRWAPLRSDPKIELNTRELSTKELQEIHRLTQGQLFWGRKVMLYGTFATILVILIGVGLLVSFNSMTVAEAKDLFPILLPPLFTLLGAAGAMYFHESGGG